MNRLRDRAVPPLTAVLELAPVAHAARALQLTGSTSATAQQSGAGGTHRRHLREFVGIAAGMGKTFRMLLGGNAEQEAEER